MSNTSGKKSISLSNTENNFTYQKCLTEYCIHLEKLEKSKQEVKNHRTAVKAWCEALEINLNCLPAEELTGNFESFVNKFVQSQINKKLREKTYKPRLSNIRNFRKFFIQHQPLHDLSEKFGERLKYVLTVGNYKPRKFWKYYLSDSIKYNTFTNWLNGSSIPSKRSYSVIDLIEEKLFLEPGMLSSLLSKNCREIRTGQTIFGKKVKKFNPLEYCKWTEELDDEFSGWVDYKTSITPPIGMKRQRNAVWSYSETDAKYPTVMRVKRAFSSFLGFCHLPSDSSDPQMRGLGIKEESLSFALLLEDGFVEKYITEFRFSRNNKTYNGGDIFFLIQATTLLRPEYGYLYQKPEFAKKLGLSIDVEKWQLKCVNIRNRLLDIYNSIERERKTRGPFFKPGRNPEEPISDILKSKHPLFAVIKLVEDMLQDTKYLDTRPLLQAALYRDALLIKFLQVNPLRIKMISVLKLDKNLLKKNGEWWVEFKKDEFKNRRFLKNDYRVRLSSEIWEMLEEYLKVYRPRLFGADKYSNLFLPSRKSSKTKIKEYIVDPSALSSAIYKRTSQYLESGIGFSAHAFRHIVPTDIIKTNPAMGYTLASFVLNDKLETVKENYAHLTTNDHFEAYNDYYSQTTNAFRSLSSDSDDQASDGGERNEKEF